MLEGLGERIGFSRAVNGMSVFVMAKPGYRRKFAQIAVSYGSNDTTFFLAGAESPGSSDQELRKLTTPPGIAHFLEHKMFDRPGGNAFDAFSSLGASANAFTGNEVTSYMFWTVDEFNRCLNLLLDLVWKPYFTQESVLKEQGIIDQEIVMYEDDPYARVNRALLETMYHVHPVRIDVTGTRESIRQITPELLYTCHSAFYRPSNMALFVAGDFDAAHEPLRIAEMLDEAVRDEGQPPERERPHEPPGPRAPFTHVRMQVSRPFVGIGWKDQPGGTDGRALLRREIATNLLLDILFGKSSTVFAKLYERGVVDDLGIGYEAWPDYAFAALTAETVEPARFLDEVSKEIDLARAKGIHPRDFERAKNAALGRYITLFDDLDLIASSQIQLHLLGQDVFSYGRTLQDITLEDVEERLPLLSPHCQAHVLLVPNASSAGSDEQQRNNDPDARN